MSLQDIVDVQISVSSKTPTRPGFGTLMIVGPNAPWGTQTDRVRTFGSYDAVIDPADGQFSSTDPEAIAALVAFSQDPAPTEIKIGYWDTVNDADVFAALTAINDVDPEWYFLVVVDHTPTVVRGVGTGAANWAEANSKLFFTSSQDAAILDPASTADIGYLLQQDGFARTVTMYHQDADTLFPEAGFVGTGAPADPGSITWKFKNIATIAVSSLTKTQADAAVAKNVNIFEQIAGIRMTREGVVAAGEFIDVIRGRDFLKATIETQVFTVLANAPKVSFTQKGIDAVASAVRRSLNIAVDQAILAPDPAPTVTVPDVLNTDPADRANRILKTIEFDARLAGAIHVVQVRGRVTV